MTNALRGKAHRAACVWGWAALVLTGALAALAVGAEGPLETGPESKKAAFVRATNVLRKRVRERMRPLARERQLSDPALAAARLSLEKAQLLLGGYRPSYFRNMRISKALGKGKLAAAQIGSGRLVEKERRGFHEKAYLSDIDFSPQPYLVYVPSGYDGKERVGLLVFLHGYASDLDKVNWIEMMYSEDMERLAEREGFIALMPFGRSNTEFMGVGEADVLRAIACVKREYKIDGDRVIVSGASMGGTGAYTIACHYPHLFAGVFTITGRVDYYQWMGIEKRALPRFKQIQTDVDYPRELLPNLAHIPVYIFHGQTDPLLRVEQSRLMARLLRELKQPVRYKELAGRGHYIWSAVFTDPSLSKWMRERRRPVAPRRVAYRTYSLKYSRAYWLRIDRFQRWGELASVAAEILDRGRIRVQSENVAAMTLRPGRALLDWKRPVRVEWNGKVETCRPTLSGGISLLRGPVLPRALRKTRDLCGPVREAFASRFLLVYGTCGSAADAKKEAQRAQGGLLDWYQFAKGVAAMKSDKRVTDADIRDCHLILFGSPSTNRLVKRIAPDLPIKIKNDVYVVGPRKFPRGEASLLMIYPNPLNRKRYVVIADGEPWGKMLPANHKLDLVPDFVIFRQEADKDGTMFQTNRFLCAGYFDSAWQLSDRLTWTR